MKKWSLLVSFCMMVFVSCSNEEVHSSKDEVATSADIKKISAEYEVNVCLEDGASKLPTISEVESFCKLLAEIKNIHFDIKRDSLNRSSGMSRVGLKSDGKEDIFKDMKLETGTWGGDSGIIDISKTKGIFTATVSWSYWSNKYFECWGADATAEGAYSVLWSDSNFQNCIANVSTTKCVFGNWRVDFEFTVELRNKEFALMGFVYLSGYCDVFTGDGKVGY